MMPVYILIVAVKARPSEEEIIHLRGLMLTFIDRIIATSGEILEDELQCFLNFVSTINEVTKAMCSARITSTSQHHLSLLLRRRRNSKGQYKWIFHHRSDNSNSQDLCLLTVAYRLRFIDY